jgi:hypothetical protein
MPRKKKQSDFVDIEFNPAGLYKYRYLIAAILAITGETREEFLTRCLEDYVWLKSPKQIVVGTDGSARLEVVEVK